MKRFIVVISMALLLLTLCTVYTAAAEEGYSTNVVLTIEETAPETSQPQENTQSGEAPSEPTTGKSTTVSTTNNNNNSNNFLAVNTGNIFSVENVSIILAVLCVTVFGLWFI